MLNHIPYKKILFLDIETVPEAEKWEDLTERTQHLWDKKTFFQRENNNTSAKDFYDERAGILAEFGKIVCISCGIVLDDQTARIKSFYGYNEQKILTKFNEMLQENFFKPDHLLCAHNGKEFDFPYISRRMLINQIELPRILQSFGKKPWEIPHLDTMELWKFGDFKNYTSLDLLANIFGIKTPKDDMDGSMVRDAFYKDDNIEEIKKYCEKDVLTLINVFRKMRYDSIIESAEAL